MFPLGSLTVGVFIGALFPLTHLLPAWALIGYCFGVAFVVYVGFKVASRYVELRDLTAETLSGGLALSCAAAVILSAQVGTADWRPAAGLVTIGTCGMYLCVGLFNRTPRHYRSRTDAFFCGVAAAFGVAQLRRSS